MIAELRDLAYAAIVRVLPGPIAGRVLPGLIRQFRETSVTTVDNSARRLLIAPVNSAGQGYAWARAAERLPGVAAASYMFRGDDDVFGFTADHVIPATALLSNARWRNAQRKAILGGFTHVIVESGIHLYESNGPVLALVRMLQQHGIRVALLWHGSDIRLPSAHARRERDSPFAHGYPDTAVLEKIAGANRTLIEDAGVAAFVSTPDLLAVVPEASWLPVVVDSSVWATDRPVLGGDLPIVLHAPSKAGLKGTQQIGAAARALHDEGLIDYREVTGISASSMPQQYAEADIVLDQFLLGSYGVAACEAMAAGRIVIGHLSDSVRHMVKEQTGYEVPIVQSRADELEEVLREIIRNRSRFAEHAALGPKFVDNVHDGARSSEVLRSFLDS